MISLLHFETIAESNKTMYTSSLSGMSLKHNQFEGYLSKTPENASYLLLLPLAPPLAGEGFLGLLCKKVAHFGMCLSAAVSLNLRPQWGH